MDVFLEAAQILERANEKEGSLKTLVYSSTYKNLRQLFALVSECVKYQAVLEEVLSHCQANLLKDKLINGDNHLAVVLLYEHLIGRGFGKAGHIRKAFVKHKSEIKSACQVTLQNHNSKSLRHIVREKQGNTSKIPRYARVNLVKCTLQEAVEKLEAEGWIYHGTLGMESFDREIGNLTEDMFASDFLLNDLLVFPGGTDLHSHPLVLSGVLALQDKASCIPAHVLDPEPGTVVLDCCAAPGNKTCHLASLMSDKGRVIALDRDLKRMTTMKSLLSRSGFTCIELIHQDFLTITPTSEDASQIKSILVDPSCSGSGMAGSRICPSDEQVDPWRLETLKRFQISILKHALRFPNVQRVVYSTCSVHQQENEEVVEEVMEIVKDYFQFESVFPELSDCRGLKQFLHHRHFLRLSPEKDLTLGFFVACFERIKSAEKTGQDKVLTGTDKMEEDMDCCNPVVPENETGRKKKRKRKEQEDCEDDSMFTGGGRTLSTSYETNEKINSTVEEDQMGQAKKHKKKHKREKRGDLEFSSESVPVSKGKEGSVLPSEWRSHCLDENSVESRVSEQFHLKLTDDKGAVGNDNIEDDTLLMEEKVKKNKKKKKRKEREEILLSSEAIAKEERALEVDNCLSKKLAVSIEDSVDSKAALQAQERIPKRRKKRKKSKEKDEDSDLTEATSNEKAIQEVGNRHSHSKELAAGDDSMVPFQLQKTLRKSKKKHKKCKEEVEESISTEATSIEGVFEDKNCPSKESERKSDNKATFESQERILKKRKKKHRKNEDEKVDSGTADLFTDGCHGVEIHKHKKNKKER